MLKISQSPKTLPKIIRVLDALLSDAKSFLVVMHDNPDPDTLASGMALAALADQRYNLGTTLTYGGLISRAENKSMVQVLDIPAVPFEQIRVASFDKIAMVDSQPGRGNNSLPPGSPCHLVFDHHVDRGSSPHDVLIYNRHIGSTSTLLAELLIAMNIEIKTNLATAIAYAIRSETQELRREAGKRDGAIYLMVYPLSSLRKIGAIAYPNLPNSYFEMLAIALEKARMFRHLLFVPIGDVSSPEIVAELADLFLRRERVTWVLAMGKYQDRIFFSMRTTHNKGQAFRVLQIILGDSRNAGGHDTFAGGQLAIQEKQFDWNAFVNEIALKFATFFRYQDTNWKPLIHRHGDMVHR